MLLVSQNCFAPSENGLRSFLSRKRFRVRRWALNLCTKLLAETSPSSYCYPGSTTVHDIQPILESLAGQAHSEGGWGYAPGQAGHLVPTCLALLALSLEPDNFAAVIARGRQFVEQCAVADGSYRLARGRDEAVWPTALVLFVKSVLEAPAAEVQRSAARLLTLRGRQTDNAAAGEVHDIDVRLIGWPWAEGHFSWAEPTAWACLALRRTGHTSHLSVQEGLQLLLDRTSAAPLLEPTPWVSFSRNGNSSGRTSQAATSSVGGPHCPAGRLPG
jgi:hypothetical protein